jgi:hypothetical protein
MRSRITPYQMRVMEGGGPVADLSRPAAYAVLTL